MLPTASVISPSLLQLFVDYSCTHCPSGIPIRNNNRDAKPASTMAKAIHFHIIQDFN
jgi:hypothetical protein